jgi:hypothetical protein
MVNIAVVDISYIHCIGIVGFERAKSEFLLSRFVFEWYTELSKRSLSISIVDILLLIKQHQSFVKVIKRKAYQEITFGVPEDRFDVRLICQSNIKNENDILVSKWQSK